MKGTLYSNYFANNKNSKGLCLAICRYRPQWLDFKQENILWIQNLAPSSELMKEYKENKLDEIQFIDQYMKQLSNDSVAKNILKHIEKHLCKGTDITLLCYEAKDKFCHRNILIELFEKKGYNTSIL